LTAFLSADFSPSLPSAGVQLFRAAPDFASRTTETRGVPNLFRGLSAKGLGFKLVLKVFAGRGFLSCVRQQRAAPTYSVALPCAFASFVGRGFLPRAREA